MIVPTMIIAVYTTHMLGLGHVSDRLLSMMANNAPVKHTANTVAHSPLVQGQKAWKKMCQAIVDLPLAKVYDKRK